jgi:hypothetical protein
VGSVSRCREGTNKSSSERKQQRLILVGRDSDVEKFYKVGAVGKAGAVTHRFR